MSKPRQYVSEDRPSGLYLHDMLDACEKIVAYTTGMDQAAFLGDGRTYDAALRNLIVLGEAAAHVSNTIRTGHPEIPWRDIIGARNRIIHAYIGIDDDLIWIMVQRSVPGLIPQLHAVLAEAEGRDPADPS